MEQLFLNLPRPDNPLVQRFGKDFFKQIPRAAGVYVMTHSSGRVLYVGQSGNLRVRLAYYKNARAGREPTRILRLVHQVHSMSWELCTDAESAQLRENELLRLHRPRFNVANALSFNYLFLFLRFEPGAVSWRADRNHARISREIGWGAFKQRGTLLLAMGGLARLLWASEHPEASVQDLPVDLLQAKPKRGVLPLTAAGLAGDLKSFFDGKSKRLVDRVFPAPRSDRFLSQLLETDFLALQNFQRFGAERNSRLREDFPWSDELIPQDRLDDLLVLQKRPKVSP